MWPTPSTSPPRPPPHLNSHSRIHSPIRQSETLQRYAKMPNRRWLCYVQQAGRVFFDDITVVLFIAHSLFSAAKCISLYTYILLFMHIYRNIGLECWSLFYNSIMVWCEYTFGHIARRPLSIVAHFFFLSFYSRSSTSASAKGNSYKKKNTHTIYFVLKLLIKITKCEHNLPVYMMAIV